MKYNLEWYKEERKRLIIENGKLKNIIDDKNYDLKMIMYAVKQLEKIIEKSMKK